MRKRRPASDSAVRTTGRRSTSPLLDRTSRTSTNGASTRIPKTSSFSSGCSTKRNRGGELPGTTSTSQACRVDERAPVSTFAFTATPPRSGKATHSRQPITVGTVINLKH